MPNQPVILNGLLFLAHLFSIEGRCHRQRPSLFIWITASSLSIRSRWKLDRLDVIDTNDLLSLVLRSALVSTRTFCC